MSCRSKRFKTIVRFCGMGFSGLALTNCSSTVMCPAMVTVGDPVLYIQSIKVRGVDTALVQFTVSNIKRDGKPTDMVEIFNGIPGTKGTVVGNSLVCSRSCGFGKDSAEYTYTISAASIRDTTITTSAMYSQYVHDDKKCIHEERGGTKVSLVL